LDVFSEPAFLQLRQGENVFNVETQQLAGRLADLDARESLLHEIIQNLLILLIQLLVN